MMTTTEASVLKPTSSSRSSSRSRIGSRLRYCLLLSSAMLLSCAFGNCDAQSQTTLSADPISEEKKAPPSGASEENAVWKPLLKDSDLSGWTITNFGGEGDVELKGGELTLGFGDPLTGVTYEGKDFPQDNYEMRWEAKRVQGQDFFAGVTFPIGEEFCSFIAGGWGGSLIGISNIDGYDASENDRPGLKTSRITNGIDFVFESSQVSYWHGLMIVKSSPLIERIISFRFASRSRNPDLSAIVTSNVKPLSDAGIIVVWMNRKLRLSRRQSQVTPPAMFIPSRPQFLCESRKTPRKKRCLCRQQSRVIRSERGLSRTLRSI